MTVIHNINWMGFTLDIYSRYNTEGEDFVNRIVTGDKTWVAYVNA